ncbi:UvrY/SirA/GacA family response regulator transcription factor [Endozoicomonas numazuensis]|uniref:Chemotaxis protein CheY n=1 Tax=Endozoicomonas numazuensis TaxID=1137799 RepID=A0A081MZA3_9GAMM|nr:UvrY/SirA/GacA family response regulator transcription factor [Endozoicomonas numazuensis]KEQ11526.1 chemotaxis protein CheY [Endozoicomonas numazuensis]
MIRVLIADDHDLVRTGLSRMLSDIQELIIVGEACSGEEAIEKCRSLQPQVVLMDVRMPGIGGLEATRKISQSFPEIQVIAVTVCNDELYPTKLMEAGAAGYVTKGISIDEMVSAIKSVVIGKRYISPDIAQQMALKSLQPSSGSPFEKLSSREMQISLMIVNCEKVQAISDKLCLSTKTVNSYRYRIFEKLQINSDVELTHLAIRHGLIEAGQDVVSA